MSHLAELYEEETGESAIDENRTGWYRLRYIQWLEAKVEKFTSTNNAMDVITLLETEIEFISGDCGSIDLNVVASKLREAVKLLRQ